MKNELIQLAAEKDFKSQFFHPEPMKYSDKEPTRYYLWICELQKWLREIHNIHINISRLYLCNKTPTRFEGWNIYIAGETWEIEYEINGYFLKKTFNTFEKALEEGLFEALKLIKT